LVKAFCAAGKSLLMRYCSVAKNVGLVVYVMPSLALIRQFADPEPSQGYLTDIPKEHVICISSDDEGTTKMNEIREFMRKIPREHSSHSSTRHVCVTYQSYGTLLDNLCGRVIDVVHYDEAHHVVATSAQELVFKQDTNHCKKQIFYTATPKNANGIASACAPFQIGAEFL